MPYPCFNTGCSSAVPNPPRNTEGATTFFFATKEWCIEYEFQIRPGVRAYAWTLGNTEDTKDLCFFFHCGMCSVQDTYWRGHPYWKHTDARLRDTVSPSHTVTVPQQDLQPDPAAYLRAGCPEIPTADTDSQENNTKLKDTSKTGIPADTQNRNPTTPEEPNPEDTATR